MRADTATELIIEATDDTFAELVERDDVPTLVWFWATSCGPCRRLAPVLAELANEYAGRLRFVKVNTDTETATARAARVLAVPTLQLYRAGDVLATKVGAAAKSTIVRELIEVS